ncbi:MAG: nucleotidyltransferase family protein [Pseudomonadota bacterium]|jgi:MurNAc alpha-1-phosphate uridylyltransferase|nr:MAG: mannose-1-phosphate guanylyltransferase [Pseudomonadota bacterium]
MSWFPKSAMVLAAGLGTRMRPLTDRVPKPLIRLQEKPLIDHVLDRLAETGTEQAVVNVHHHADQIIDHLKGRDRPRVLISDERDALLDTGGGVVKALPLLGDEPFLIHNSDSTWIDGVQPNLIRLARGFDPERMDALLLLALASASIGYEGRGDFMMSPDGLLRRRPEREVVPFVYSGVCIVHPRFFANAPEGPFSLNLLFDKAIEQGRLHGIRLDGIWLHVGTPEALAEADQLFHGNYAAA